MLLADGKEKVQTECEERKRWEFYVVWIPLSVVSVYRVSIPRGFLSIRMTTPIEIFKAAAVVQLKCLQRRVSSFGSLPAGNESKKLCGDYVYYCVCVLIVIIAHRLDRCHQTGSCFWRVGVCRLETKQSTLTASF